LGGQRLQIILLGGATALLPDFIQPPQLASGGLCLCIIDFEMRSHLGGRKCHFKINTYLVSVSTEAPLVIISALVARKLQWTSDKWRGKKFAKTFSSFDADCECQRQTDRRTELPQHVQR